MSDKQYNLTGNKLVLQVKRANIISTSFLFLLAFIFMALPVIAAILGIIGGVFKIGHVVFLFVSGFIALSMLRLALWNKYGKEIITFNENVVHYIADYKWFKDAEKTEIFTQPISFSSIEIGNPSQQKARLVIGDGKSEITCVTNLPKKQLQKLIEELEKENK